MNKRRLCIIAANFLVLGMLFTTVLQPLFNSKVYAGVVLDGVNVGNASKQQVEQMLALWQGQQGSRRIVVAHDNAQFTLAAKDIDLTIDIEGTLNEVWNVGRQGFWWERVKTIHAASKNGYNVPVKLRYNESNLQSRIDDWQNSIDKPAHNAAFSIYNGSVIPQQPGLKLEAEQLKKSIVSALYEADNQTVFMPVKTVLPAISVADVTQMGLKEVLSVFTTTFDNTNANRAANIKLAAERISTQIIYPGAVFSFNEAVGPRTTSRGFKEALEIVDGEFVPGIGGGICQVSSTLYNAVLLANLSIVERYNHSKPLGYVDLGRDATVAYDILDFKFANTTKSPIMLVTEVQDDKLHIGVLGQQPLAEKIRIAVSKRKVIAPSVTKKQDADLYLGETAVVQQGTPGYEITTVRVVSKNGKEIKREVLAKDQYSPENSIVKIGTQIPPFAENSYNAK